MLKQILIETAILKIYLKGNLMNPNQIPPELKKALDDEKQFAIISEIARHMFEREGRNFDQEFKAWSDDGQPCYTGKEVNC